MKIYREYEVAKGISFADEDGEVFGLVVPGNSSAPVEIIDEHD